MCWGFRMRAADGRGCMLIIETFARQRAPMLMRYFQRDQHAISSTFLASDGDAYELQMGGGAVA
jgi:hypothetical protein